MTSARLAFLIPLAALVAAVLLWLVLPPASVERVVDEGGLVETATVGVYVLALISLFWNRSAATDQKTWAAVFVAMTAFAARELDLHIEWTGISVLKGSFYLGAAPLLHKLVGFTAVAISIASLVYLVTRHGRRMWNALRQGDPVAVTVAVFIATMVISKGFDRAASLLINDAGIPVSASIQALFRSIEETLELTLPALVLLAWSQWRRAASGTSPQRPVPDAASPREEGAKR